jgi:hypothetical protein
MNKKLFTGSVGLVVFTVAILGSAYAQSDSPACDNKLIAGNYRFTIQGTKLAGKGPVGPEVGVAMTEFDGKGGLPRSIQSRLGAKLWRTTRIREPQVRTRCTPIAQVRSPSTSLMAARQLS